MRGLYGNSQSVEPGIPRASRRARILSRGRLRPYCGIGAFTAA